MLSVIVPIYNVSAFIYKCVESLENQTFKDMEVIFVDDGSTDNSKEQLLKCLDSVNFKYSVHSKKNGGLSDARNFGLQFAKKTYVTFLDPDDWLSNNYYEDLVSGMLASGSEIGCSSHNEIFKSKVVPTRYKEQTIQIKQNLSCIWAYKWSACTKVFKRDLFDLDVFDVGVLYEDLALVPFLTTKCNKMYVSSNAIYNYLRHDNSILGRTDIKKEYDIFKALNLLLVRLKDTEFRIVGIRIMFTSLILSFSPIIYLKYKSERYSFTKSVVEFIDIKTNNGDLKECLNLGLINYKEYLVFKFFNINSIVTSILISWGYRIFRRS